MCINLKYYRLTFNSVGSATIEDLHTIFNEDMEYDITDEEFHLAACEELYEEIIDGEAPVIHLQLEEDETIVKYENIFHELGITVTIEEISYEQMREELDEE